MDNEKIKKTSKLKLALISMAFIPTALTSLLYMDFSQRPQRQISAKILIVPIELYRKHISRHLHGFINCRFTPSCSLYAELAIQTYGTPKGIAMTITRLFKCTYATTQFTIDYP